MGSNPTQGSSFFLSLEKGVVLGGLELFALPLPLLPREFLILVRVIQVHARTVLGERKRKYSGTSEQGTFGANSFVPFREVVPISEVKYTLKY